MKGTSIVVAMLTYRRPELLAQAVPALLEQVTSAATRARLVVVDNDPAGGARAAVERWSGEPVTYVHEPRPGISAARNAALDHAGDADAIVFIDDDEVPSPGWLDHLVGAWRAWGCTAVAGPVVPVFDGPVDPWIDASGMFARRCRATGTWIRGAATNNLLLDLAALRASGLRFDDAFGLTGGSDTRLTHELVLRGHEIRWCDEAEVTAVVPGPRTSREYVLRRNFRTGTTWSRVKLALAEDRSRLLRRADLVVRGCVRTARGSAQLGWGWASGSLRHRALGACAVASGSGMLLGAVGYRYVEYARRAPVGG